MDFFLVNFSRPSSWAQWKRMALKNCLSNIDEFWKNCTKSSHWYKYSGMYRPSTKHPQNGNIWLVKCYIEQVQLFWGCLIILTFLRTSLPPSQKKNASRIAKAHHGHGFVGATRNFHQIHRCFFQLLGSKPSFSRAGSLKMGSSAPPPLCLRRLEPDSRTSAPFGGL